MSQAKVSVIIAVYNVEEYIERCLHTLFGQTLDSMEYIFVDDVSPDSSVEIIEKTLKQYPERKEQVKIIRHKENMGVAAARTSGIKAATGEYMIHCDPDDYVELTMYEEMYNEAKKSDSDIVICNYKVHFDGKTVLCEAPQINKSLDEYLRNKKNINRLHNETGLWNKLIRSSIILEKEIYPFAGGDYAEDYGCLFRIFYYSRSMSNISHFLYHYFKREDSLTVKVISKRERKKYYEKIKVNIDRLSDFFQDKPEWKSLRDYMRLKFKMEWRDIYSDNPKEWFELYRDSHVAIRHLHGLNWKARLFWAAILFNRSIFIFGNNLHKKITGRTLVEY